jgi:hypothetical protein
VKLGIIVNNADALKAAYGLKLKSGSRAFKLRSKLVEFEKQMEIFNAMKNDAIKATGKEQIGQNDPEFAEIVTMLNEAVTEDVDITVEPLIEMADLESAELSAKEIDGIIALGLFKVEDQNDCPK